MPVVPAVETSEGLCDVEVKKSEGRKGPLLIVEPIKES